MNVEELTRSLHDTAVPTSPDLDGIVARGRRIRVRRRAAGAGIALGVAAVVSAPFIVVSQFDDPRPLPIATAPAASYPIADPDGRVVSNLNKFYLEGDTSSRGLMSIWAEAGELRYGWTSESNGEVRTAGTLLAEAAMASGLKVAVVPSAGAMDTEPTFVVTMPLAAGESADDYSMGVMAQDARLQIRTHARVADGFVIFTFSPLEDRGGVPDVSDLTVTAPDGSTSSVALLHGADGWTSRPLP